MVTEKVLPSDFVFAICRGKDFRADTDTPARRAPFSERFIGYIDVFDVDSVCGWVTDMLDPLKPVDVDIYIDDDFTSTVRCDILRPDLIATGYGDGGKSFHARFPTRDKLSTSAVAKLIIHGSGELVVSRTRDAEG